MSKSEVTPFQNSNTDDPRFLGWEAFDIVASALICTVHDSHAYQPFHLFLYLSTISLLLKFAELCYLGESMFLSRAL
jgi:hypothetical protein